MLGTRTKICTLTVNCTWQSTSSQHQVATSWIYEALTLIAGSQVRALSMAAYGKTRAAHPKELQCTRRFLDPATEQAWLLFPQLEGWDVRHLSLLAAAAASSFSLLYPPCFTLTIHLISLSHFNHDLEWAVFTSLLITIFSHLIVIAQLFMTLILLWRTFPIPPHNALSATFNFWTLPNISNVVIL